MHLIIHRNHFKNNPQYLTKITFYFYAKRHFKTIFLFNND